LGSAKYPALDLRFAPGPGAGALQDFLYAELDAFEPLAIQEHETGDGWRVFFRTRSRRDDARVALLAEFANALLELSPVDVDDEDWATRSQAGLKAVRAGRIIVAPPWDLPAPERSEPATADILIVIEPSMGFGTGHHATTRLCLELLQKIDLAGTRVIDVGTGSGVLAIAAAKCGAASVLAVDNDPDALLNARDNITRNHVQAIELQEADIAALNAVPADVILANLTAAVLQRSATSLARLIAPGGTAVVSGFGPDELQAVTSAFAGRVIERARDGDWAAASLQV
jgi:ribosomal protein L11 methyltransferase